MSAAFDAGDPSQRRFTAYGPAAFPDSRDEQIDQYVETLRTSGPPAVRVALDTVSDKGRQVLCSYAERAASRAVRDNSRSTLVLGLIALVVGGLEQNALESLTQMPLIEDAANRLGLAPSDVFEDAADVVGHPGSVNLMVWLSRAPADRTLECMGFEAFRDDSGFRYRFTT